MQRMLSARRFNQSEDKYTTNQVLFTTYWVASQLKNTDLFLEGEVSRARLEFLENSTVTTTMLKFLIRCVLCNC